jgi:hypothetical protein
LSRALAVAVGVVLFHAVLAGIEADFGVDATLPCAALLLVAIGLGLRARGELPFLGEGLALVLLVPLRGPIVDFARWGLPGPVEDVGAALLSLVPLGYALGRQLRPALRAALAWQLVGVCVGEVAVLAGAMSWLPLWLSGGATIAALFALRELEEPGALEQELPPVLLADRLAAFALGAALGLLIWVLGRVTPGYATPGPGFPSWTALALLGPAALVAWPGSLLAREGWPRRTLAAVGGVLLAAAAVRSLAHLSIHENAVAHVDLSFRRHGAAVELVNLLPAAAAQQARRLPLDALSWLVLFAGLLAATSGVALGARRGRELAWLLFGGALAALAPCALRLWPVQAPAGLMLAASGLALMSAALALFGPRGLLALPLALLPWLDVESDIVWRRLPSFEEMRRPGEYTIDSVMRSPAADVLLFVAPGRGSAAVVGADAHAMSFTHRTPAFGFDAEGEPVAHFAEPAAPPPESEPSAQPVPALSRGIRVNGVPLHAGHPPLGPEGSTGRMLRLFAREGRAFVTGVGAELLAADLNDADLATETTVCSPAPLGSSLLALVLEDSGSGGWQPGTVFSPRAGVAQAWRHDFATVLVAPAPPGTPEALAQLTEERLARLRDLVAHEGRCLAWVDTTALSAPALAARLAAFGSVFEGRAAAFVEPRELDPPFVLLVGWVSDAGAPKAAELSARLPAPDSTGWRVELRSLADLGALLVADGESLLELAPGPVLARGRPMAAGPLAPGGWEAVSPLFDPEARLSRAIVDAPDAPRPSAELLAGLAQHAHYDYRLENLNQTALEIRPDIDWAAWELEVADYERAAQQQPDSPLLRHALAALLEPLVIDGDFGRFAQVWTRCGAGQMPSWRLALQEWWAQKGSLEEDAAEEAAERAKELRERD